MPTFKYNCFEITKCYTLPTSFYRGLPDSMICHTVLLVITNIHPKILPYVGVYEWYLTSTLSTNYAVASISLHF